MVSIAGTLKYFIARALSIPAMKCGHRSMLSELLMDELHVSLTLRASGVLDSEA
jgi:hypothetical protein